MTDKEIIKALKECEECHYYNECEKSTRLALDLINRQKAEIERLKSLERNVYETVEELKNKIESEARKEFAERLKSEIRENMFAYPADEYCEQIDNLLKEMEKET